MLGFGALGQFALGQVSQPVVLSIVGTLSATEGADTAAMAGLLRRYFPAQPRVGGQAANARF